VHVSGGRERDWLMVFGYNTNLRAGNATFHVQTEDRGEAHGLIDTTVYYRGRVLHRRTNNYFDLLPLNADREGALRLRVDEQHRTVLEDIRSGKLQLAIPTEAPATLPEKPGAQVASPSLKLALELTNARSWLSGKHAKLEVVVRHEGGGPVNGARVGVEFEGSEGGENFHGQTDSGGGTVIEFELPRIASPDAAMVISAEHGVAKGHLRFALRAKPRVVTR
jgi:hypothetical protein